MQLIRGINNLRPEHLGAVATIGGFDGVHRGHQALLAALRARAAELRASSLAISFEPTPREYFRGAAAPPRLQRFREKFEALQTTGIDYFACLHFDEYLSGLSARDFVAHILRDGLRIRWLVVGHDFKFGHGREGNVSTLRELGSEFGFGVDEFRPFMVDGRRISSTLVREALALGDMQRAAELLGRPYRISGRVVRGNQLGRQLGFPTANLRLQRRVIPLHGVFAVRVMGKDIGMRPAVANLGTRPVVNGIEPLLEVYLFDFAGDLYGQQLHVHFVARLRDERWFPNLDELVQQMKIDAAEARNILGC